MHIHGHYAALCNTVSVCLAQALGAQCFFPVVQLPQLHRPSLGQVELAECYISLDSFISFSKDMWVSVCDFLCISSDLERRRGE